MAFRGGQMAKDATWKTAVLITKVTGDLWVIGLVEVIWKMATVILNHRIGMVINFHNGHGFHAGRGTGTAYLEAKLIQQLATTRWEVLYDMFLDLHKSYNDLDRDRFLGILVAYGVGSRGFRLLRKYGDRLNMVARAGGYFWT